MFHCKGCQAKDKEIEYLRRLIDHLLEKLNVSPVIDEGLKEELKEEEPEEGTEIIG